MSDVRALAMLALRRIQGHLTVPTPVGRGAAEERPSRAADPAALTGGDLTTLGRVLRRAVDRTWFALELLFCREMIGPRLGRGGDQPLESIFGHRSFEQLAGVPGPFRQPVWRALHAARRSGPLTLSDVDLADLLPPLAGFSRPADPLAAHDLEWYALWQLAGETARAGYAELRPLFEARTTDGGPLLVDLVNAFLPHELAVEGHPLRAGLGPGPLTAQDVRWLCEHAEPIEQLLNEAYGGGRTETPSEVSTRLRQGQVFAQQGQYERAVIEFTAALQFDLPVAAPYVHRGDAFRHRGEYDRAVADYTQALRLEPNNLAARLNRGLVYRLTGKPDAAVADLTEALKFDSRNVAALNGRGGAYADLGRYDLAIADHTQALRLDPSLAWAYQARGDAYAGRREYDRAIADYTEALRLNPHFPLAHANRGDAYRLAGDLDRAAADYTEALRLDPLNPRMYTNRGETFRRQGRYDLALADFGEVIRLDPTNPAGYLNRGIAYQLAGNYDQAVANFNLAEQFDAGNPEVFLQRAKAHEHRRSFEQAITDLGRVIELNPRDAVAYVRRGGLFAQTRRFDRAVTDFTEAVRLDPTSAQARLERGRVHAQAGDFDRALADCGEALRLDPHFVPAMLVRGGVLLRSGEYAAALEEFNRALAANPRYARAYNDRGVAYTRLGMLEAAVLDFSRAIDISPDYPQALANRGNALHLQGRHEPALADFTRAVVVDAKYAATYSLLRGLTEFGRKNYRQALADYAVALAVDPRNKAARAAQAEARALLESDFVVMEGPPGIPPVPPAGLSTTLRLPAPPTQEAPAAADDVVADVEVVEAAAENTAAEPAVVTAEPAEYEAEQAEYEAKRQRELAAQEQARLQALAEKAAELRRKNEAEEAKRRVDEAKRDKKTGRRRRDPDEEKAVWRRRKQYAVIAVGTLILGYWGVQGVWAVIPRAKNPFHTIPAEQFVGEYAQDAAKADDKYADQTLALKGKIVLVTDKTLRVRTKPPRVFFDVPGAKEDLKVECLFDDVELASSLQPETEYVIAGKIERYKPGKGLKLKNANVLSKGAGKPAARLVGPPVALAPLGIQSHTCDVAATALRSKNESTLITRARITNSTHEDDTSSPSETLSLRQGVDSPPVRHHV